MQQLFQRLTSLPPSDRKQHAIHSAVVSCAKLAVQNPTNINRVPLELCLQLVQENIEDAQDTQLTVEAALLQQLNAKTLLGAMTLLVFIRLGMNPRELHLGTPFRHAVSRSLTSIQETQVVEKLVALLRIFRAWATRHLRRYPLATNLTRMDATDQREFLRLRDELAVQMGEITFDSSSVHGIISNIRGLRAIAQVADLHRRRRAADPVQDNSALSHFESFLIAFTNEPSSAIGRILVDQEAVYFWTMKEWSTQLRRFSDFQPQLHVEATRLEFDQWFSLLVSQYFLSDSHNAAYVACADFTGLALPCTILQNPDASRPWFLHAGFWKSTVQTSKPRVLYCGRIQYSSKPMLAYDDKKRTVLDRRSHEIVLEYPEFGHIDRLKRFARELPYASYERWLLQDMAKTHDNELDLLCDEAATRPRFLSVNPTDYRVIHLSTHGEGDETVPECSRLEMGYTTDSGKALSFIDIQSMDWSKTELVFLNACHSAVGRRSSGEGSLSLAWAFSTGGAKAVIATRWSIDDDAAWYFARCFYEAWQFSAKEWSMVRAFHDALEKTRHHESFSRPSIWGAFTLLHAGVILH